MLNNLKSCGNRYWVLGVHLFCRWTFWSMLITSQLVIMLPKGGWCTCLLQWPKCWVFTGSATSLRTLSSTPRTCSLWQYSPPRGTPSPQATSSWKQASNSEGKVSYPFWDWGQYREEPCSKTPSQTALSCLKVPVFLPQTALLNKRSGALHISLNLSWTY